MTTVSIVYHSGSGHTTKLAEAVAKGASTVPGVQVKAVPVEGKDIVEGRFKNPALMEQLDGSDAIIFGSPTYMGGPSGQFKTFADATAGAWFGQKWKDKVASGFSVSNSPAGDKFSTLQYLHTLAMQHGMIWVGLGEMPMQPNGVNRLGSFAGATAQAGQEHPDVAPSEGDKLTGEVLGRRVAETAKRWKAGKE
jgi:NAD(P)H dehydrogenase (quinone)